MKHPHTFLAGLTGGLVLSQEALVILVAGVVIGAGAVLAWGTITRAARWARRSLGRAPAGPPPYDWRRPW